MKILVMLVTFLRRQLLAARRWCIGTELSYYEGHRDFHLYEAHFCDQKAAKLLREIERCNRAELCLDVPRLTSRI